MKELNARGFSHDILLVAVVGIFAISGVGFLVASHADSCDPHAAVGCLPTTKSGGAVATASGLRCSLSGVPKKPIYGQVVTPVVTIKNIGKLPTGVHGLTSIFTYNSSGKHGGKGGPIEYLKLAAKQSFDTSFSPYTVGYASPEAHKISFGARSTARPSFACNAVMELPALPLKP